MKMLLRVFMILAVIHLLAIIGFVGWMAGTGHLDGRRLDELKSMVNETVAKRDARELEAQREAEAAAQKPDDEVIPLTAEQKINRKLGSSEADRQVVQRMRREVQDLQRTLQLERTKLDESRATFLAERDAFEQQREKIRQIEGDEQFQGALATLAAMKADQAHSLLLETLSIGPDGYDTVVAYLNSMSARKRAEIMGKFEEKDPVLAADLLERLRTRGVGATAAGPTP